MRRLLTTTKLLTLFCVLFITVSAALSINWRAKSIDVGKRNELELQHFNNFLVDNNNFIDDDDADETTTEEEEEEVEDENSISTSNEDFRLNHFEGRCPKEMFLRGGKCRPCSQCGPDLYVREACSASADTICDWCLNPSPPNKNKNKDFERKCAEIIRIQSQFNQLLEDRSVYAAAASSSSSSESNSKEEEEGELGAVSTKSHIEIIGWMEESGVRGRASRFFSRMSTFAISSWKSNLLIELCVYLIVVAIIFVGVKTITRRKRAATAAYYRTVTLTPPVLDESDKKNIIRAADSIREKIGKKGYERLEEFI